MESVIGHSSQAYKIQLCLKFNFIFKWLICEYRTRDCRFYRPASHLRWWDPTSRLRPRGRRWGAACTPGEWWRWRIQNTTISSSCGPCWCELQRKLEKETHNPLFFHILENQEQLFAVWMIVQIQSGLWWHWKSNCIWTKYSTTPQNPHAGPTGSDPGPSLRELPLRTPEAGRQVVLPWLHSASVSCVRTCLSACFSAPPPTSVRKPLTRLYRKIKPNMKKNVVRYIGTTQATPTAVKHKALPLLSISVIELGSYKETIVFLFIAVKL